MFFFRFLENHYIQRDCILFDDYDIIELQVDGRNVLYYNYVYYAILFVQILNA